MRHAQLANLHEIIALEYFKIDTDSVEYLYISNNNKNKYYLHNFMAFSVHYSIKIGTWRLANDNKLR